MPPPNKVLRLSFNLTAPGRPLVRRTSLRVPSRHTPGRPLGPGPQNLRAQGKPPAIPPSPLPAYHPPLPPQRPAIRSSPHPMGSLRLWLRSGVVAYAFGGGRWCVAFGSGGGWRLPSVCGAGAGVVARRRGCSTASGHMGLALRRGGSLSGYGGSTTATAARLTAFVSISPANYIDNTVIIW